MDKADHSEHSWQYWKYTPSSFGSQVHMKHFLLQDLQKQATPVRFYFSQSQLTFWSLDHNCKPLSPELEYVSPQRSRSACRVAERQWALMATCVHYLTALSSVQLPLDSTCEEEAETPFLKIKAPRLNFWTISEAPARNLDCSFSLPSIMHLSRRHIYLQPPSDRPILYWNHFKPYPWLSTTVYRGFELGSREAVTKHLSMYILWPPNCAVRSGCVASKYIGSPKVKVLVPVISLPDAVAKWGTSLDNRDTQGCCMHLLCK